MKGRPRPSEDADGEAHNTIFQDEVREEESAETKWQVCLELQINVNF